MNDYEPTSRRPIAAAFRRTADLAVRLSLKWRIHADVISYSSIVAALAAGICFWQSAAWPFLLLVGPLFCFLRLWLNMLDGMVALAAGQASYRGEILNDLPDRLSDVIIFTGVAHSGLTNPFFAYWAALLALITAYVGLFGQAVGTQREFSGVMSKPWRMVAVALGAWATWLALRSGREIRFAGFTILDWASLVVVAGCVQTIIVRLKRILAALHNQSR